MAKKATTAVVIVAAVLAIALWLREAGEVPDADGVAVPAASGETHPPGEAPRRAAEDPEDAAVTEEAPGTAPSPGEPPDEGEERDPPTPDRRVHGRILDPDRRPVADAAVTVRCADGQVVEVRTGADGAFRIPEVTVKASGHLMQHFLATDGRGRWARRTLYQRVAVGADEPVEFKLAGVGMGDLLLRDASSLEVRVTAGGAPVAGARVWAVEEADYDPRTEDHLTEADGRAVLEHLPHGRWSVHAEAPGRGAGRRSVVVPGERAVEVVLFRRSLEVEVVDAATGGPVEGATLQVHRRGAGDPESWWGGYPPLAAAPTDSSGRTRIDDLGEEELRLRAIPPGLEVPPEGTPAVVVPARATSARLEAPSGRTIRFPLEAGDEGPLPEGAVVTVVGPDELLCLAVEGFAAWVDSREARVEGGALLLDWPGPGAVEGYGRAEDGRVARLRAAEAATEGSPVFFRSSRELTVEVTDEDGKPVTDSVVVVKDPRGYPLSLMWGSGEDGVSRFEGLPAAECWVCPLAHFDWGGAAVLRVDLTRGNREVEVVVGRSVPVVARVRIDGKPALPAAYEIRVVLPIPEGATGAWTAGEETVHDPAEDPDAGTITFSARAHAPGQPIRLELRVPGRDPIPAEVRPGPAGTEATVSFDL